MQPRKMEDSIAGHLIRCNGRPALFHLRVPSRLVHGRVLQLINKSFVLGKMPSNTKKKKPWSAFCVSKTLGQGIPKINIGL
jgi:hypothetical protein